ncbi:MAG: V-type ATP synthase subunit E [Ruminococcus sp.]
MAKSKTDNFLTAIKKYSALEREQIQKDIAEIKEEEIKKAQAKGKREAESYISKQYSINKAAVTSRYSVKNLESQGKLYKKREEITSNVFKKAKDKLIEFTSTPQYKDLLLGYAKEIAELFDDNSCIVYLKNDDMKFADEIKSVFSGNVDVKADNMIKIGGIIGNCKDKNIVADNTLDSKLDNQKEWFTENSQLKVY